MADVELLTVDSAQRLGIVFVEWLLTHFAVDELLKLGGTVGKEKEVEKPFVLTQSEKNHEGDRHHC